MPLAQDVGCATSPSAKLTKSMPTRFRFFISKRGQIMNTVLLLLLLYPLLTTRRGKVEVQEGDGPRVADYKEEKREAPPPQRVASPRGPGVSERLGDWGRRRCGGRCAGSGDIEGRDRSGPSPPSHGSHSRMSRTRSGAGPVWSGRGGEGTSPPPQPRG